MKKLVIFAVVWIAPLCAMAAATGGNSDANEANAITASPIVNTNGKAVQDFSIDKPVTSSGPPTAPVPPAGWIGLVGLLGVIALRWFSLAKRSSARTIED